MGRLLIAARGLAFVAGTVLALSYGLLAANVVLFHGFAANCSDGSPEYDAASCGIAWRPGFPFIALALLGLVLLAGSIGSRRFTRWLLWAVGGVGVLMALALLWLETWNPVAPAPPEPAGPQLVLLGVGVIAISAGALLRPAKAPVASA